MKELEKTKRISIAAVLSILVVIIALLSYQRPKHMYTINAQNTLDKISEVDYFVPFEDINTTDYVLIDVRSNFEYNKGHLENAINIYTPEILSDENTLRIKELNATDKTMLLYGSNPDEVIAPFMLLYQLGYTNTKILTIENHFHQNKLMTENVRIEHPVADIKGFIEASVKKAAMKPKPIPKPIIKKVIPKKKKKKMPVEGGC